MVRHVYSNPLNYEAREDGGTQREPSLSIHRKLVPGSLMDTQIHGCPSSLCEMHVVFTEDLHTLPCILDHVWIAMTSNNAHALYRVVTSCCLAPRTGTFSTIFCKWWVATLDVAPKDTESQLCQEPRTLEHPLGTASSQLQGSAEKELGLAHVVDAQH